MLSNISGVRAVQPAATVMPVKRVNKSSTKPQPPQPPQPPPRMAFTTSSWPYLHTMHDQAAFKLAVSEWEKKAAVLSKCVAMAKKSCDTVVSAVKASRPWIHAVARHCGTSLQKDLLSSS